jgi:hypothetical protein
MFIRNQTNYHSSHDRLVPKACQKEQTPRIQPSISAVFRSFGSSSGQKNFSRLPSQSPRCNHLAIAKASCWSGVRPALRKVLLQKRRINLCDDRTIGRCAPTVERPEMHVIFGVLPDVPSQGIPASVDFATEPYTSKWNTDLAVRARSSVTRRQRGLPERAAPFPLLPSRTKST